MYNLFEEQLKEWEADKLESKKKIEENKQLVSRIEKLEEDLRTSG
uniref:Phage protein n=1 Tax=Caenorhabditis tropicalis TaxID=1561998 RepID=A0A1I7T011_9PELO